MTAVSELPFAVLNVATPDAGAGPALDRRLAKARFAERMETVGGSWALHNRRPPKTLDPIDHIVCTTGGVHVIDVKQYTGRPPARVDGGRITQRPGGRDLIRHIDGVHRQVGRIAAALAADDQWSHVPVGGILCLIDEDWPLLGAAFTMDGVSVLGPSATVERLSAAGPVSIYTVAALHRFLSAGFPPNSTS
jgi:hypothetical protein